MIPDIEGPYVVQLLVSDFIGPGLPHTVVITATTAANFAEAQILAVSDIVSALTESQVTTTGNQNAFLNFLSQAVVALQSDDDVVEAIDKLNQALERTDGCVLRGSPDGNGAGRDWIIDCEIQAEVHELLTLALDVLAP